MRLLVPAPPPHSFPPALRMLLIGTDPYREPMWQLEVCPHYKRLKGIQGVGKYSYLLRRIIRNPWTQQCLHRKPCVHWKGCFSSQVGMDKQPVGHKQLDQSTPLPWGCFICPCQIPHCVFKCFGFLTLIPCKTIFLILCPQKSRVQRRA